MFGHIKLDRKIQKWEWYQDSKMVHVFIHLLLNANHKDGSYRGIEIKRGQMITGRLKLATALNLSERTIRTCLLHLKKTKEIEIKTTKKYSIITICKYDTYQSSEPDKRPTESPTNDQQVTNRTPTNDQQVTTNNNVKNDKNGKNVNNGASHVLTNSNLFRKPNIPVFSEVHRVFLQNGGTEEMAKTFYEKNEGVDWYYKGSPITNFSNLVPSYVQAWKRNNQQKNVKKGFNEVPEDVDYDNLKL